MTQPRPDSIRLVGVVTAPLTRMPVSTGQAAVQSKADGDVRSRLKLLTPREHQVLEMVLEGLTSRQIAGQLSRSYKTVQIHRSHIMQKLNVHNVAQLVRAVMIVPA